MNGSVNSSELVQARLVIGDLITRELSLIVTSYGQLVYLAGLIDANTGQYNHFTVSAGSNQESSNQWRKRHERIFQDWVAMPLKRKMADIETYIDGLNGIDRPQLIDAWLRLAPYKNLVPASIQGPERQKHISDFEAILGLLRNVYGVSSPTQEA